MRINNNQIYPVTISFSYTMYGSTEGFKQTKPKKKDIKQASLGKIPGKF